jgi:hypothetical protein
MLIFDSNTARSSILSEAGDSKQFRKRVESLVSLDNTAIEKEIIELHGVCEHTENRNIDKHPRLDQEVNSPERTELEHLPISKCIFRLYRQLPEKNL